jgi:hypothetical protein
MTILQEVLPNLLPESYPYYEQKLIEEKSYVNLFQLSSSIGNGLKSLYHHNSPEERELILSYLTPILKAGKLKVRKIKQPNLGEEFGIIEYSNYEDVIKDISTDWKLVSTTPDKIHLVEMAYHFTLPENEWK